MIKLKKGIPLFDQHDKNGMWGGKFGGIFCGESLIEPINEISKAFEKFRYDKKFLKEKDDYFNNYIGAPTRFIKLQNLTRHLGGAQIWAKVVSDAKGGSHKIYHAVVHCLLAKKMGKKAVICETGAGSFGKALSMVAKHMGLKCRVFMGKVDIDRQHKNYLAIKKNGAEVIPVYTGNQTLVDAVSACFRAWISESKTSYLAIGSTVGSTPFVKIVGWSVSQVSKELKIQLKNVFGKIPPKLKLINCVGGGSSCFSLFSEFIDYNPKQVELIGVEAGGPKNSKLHAAPLSNNSKLGVLHGSLQYVVQDKDGQISDTESVSSGLDYPGVSPLHCFLKYTKRARYTSASDEEALEAYKIVSTLENISPSLEPSHGFSEAIKIAPKLDESTIIVVGSCGDSQKDKSIIEKKLGKYIR